MGPDRRESSIVNNVIPENPTTQTHPWWTTLLLAIGHAALFILAFPPVCAWPLIMVALVPLGWLALRARSTRLAIIVVFITQLTMWLWLGRWLIPVTVAGYPVYAAYMSLYATLFVWLLRRIRHRPRFTNCPMTILVPALWIGLEVLKGKIVFGGYPWFLLAHPMIEWTLFAQSADLMGTYGVSTLVAMIGGLGVDALRVRAAMLPRTALAKLGLVTLIIVGVNLGYGSWRSSQRDSLQVGPNVLVIQTNLPQDNKIGWPLEEQKKDVAEFLRQTRDAFEQGEGRADLIVWPETMLPVHGLDEETFAVLLRWRQLDEISFAREFIDLSRELGVPMLVGAPCYLGLDVQHDKWVWKTNYNSVFLVEGDPPYQRYDKHLLTPFGETMPYISAWPWLEQKLLSIGAEGMSFTLDSSEDIRLLELKWGDRTLRMGTPICFEDTIPRVCRKMVWNEGRKQVDLFVNLSNDGWYTRFDDGRQQHLQAARYRCIENRVPMIRAVNTGLSVLIDSFGNVAATIGKGRYGEGQIAGHLQTEILLDSRLSLYGFIGDLWAWICLVGMAVLTCLTFGKSKKEE